MSRSFNQVSYQSIDRITDALVASLSETPEELQPLGRALARATEFFHVSAFLTGYGDTEEAAALLAQCRTNMVQALGHLDSITANSGTEIVEGAA